MYIVATKYLGSNQSLKYKPGESYVLGVIETGLAKAWKDGTDFGLEICLHLN